MAFSNSGDRIASYGFRTTKMWFITTGRLNFTVSHPINGRAIEVTFSGDDSKLIIGCDDRNVRFLTLDNLQAGRCLIDARLLREERSERGNSSSPSAFGVQF
jgi:hypothetical protein